ESIKMTAAVYVTGSLVKTPMASGIIAFKDKASAEKFLAEQGHGEILLFDALAVLDLKTHNK
ncbi:MAG: nitrous oxide reductase accessory protein NosL, partial [Nitrospirota bacterium]|nr:nitrous oxide reductase accessory protein NosL [Nitrospirota bacterium]